MEHAGTDLGLLLPVKGNYTATEYKDLTQTIVCFHDGGKSLGKNHDMDVKVKCSQTCGDNVNDFAEASCSGKGSVFRLSHTSISKGNRTFQDD